MNPHLDPHLPAIRSLCCDYGVNSLQVFGSVLRHDFRPNSDIDLLIVKPIREGRVKNKVAIRRAWWPLRLGSSPLSFDILLATPEEFHRPHWVSNGYHAEIQHHGLRVA